MSFYRSYLYTNNLNVETIKEFGPGSFTFSSPATLSPRPPPSSAVAVCPFNTTNWLRSISGTCEISDTYTFGAPVRQTTSRDLTSLLIVIFVNYTFTPLGN